MSICAFLFLKTGQVVFDKIFCNILFQSKVWINQMYQMWPRAGQYWSNDHDFVNFGGVSPKEHLGKIIIKLAGGFSNDFIRSFCVHILGKKALLQFSCVFQWIQIIWTFLVMGQKRYISANLMKVSDKILKFALGPTWLALSVKSRDCGPSVAGLSLGRSDSLWRFSSSISVSSWIVASF